MRARSVKVKRGSGLLNKLINWLPFEAHLPGYRYCGPGTKLQKRLKRGDPGINPLDEACKQHDIAYANHQDAPSRNIADKILAEKAWNRVQSSDATIGEKLAGRLIASIMKGKVALGAGSKSKKTKRGGFLPLIPIIAALGAAAGGAAQIASAVNKKKAADRQMSEMARHNRAMEAKGRGLRKKKRRGGFLPMPALAASLAPTSKIASKIKRNKDGNGKKSRRRKNRQSRNKSSKNSGKGLYLYRKSP